MAKYLQRPCPKCNSYLGIVIRERKAKLPVQAINGWCLKCGYRLAWVVIRGKRRRSVLLEGFLASSEASRKSTVHQTLVNSTYSPCDAV